jgi:dipeptidase
MIEYILIGVIVLQEAAFWFERRKLLNRIMATDYEQFEYYDKKFSKDIKEVEKIRDEAREERKLSDNTFVEDAELLDEEDAKKLVDGWDEDWSGDLRKVKEKKEE